MAVQNLKPEVSIAADQSCSTSFSKSSTTSSSRLSKVFHKMVPSKAKHNLKNDSGKDESCASLSLPSTVIRQISSELQRIFSYFDENGDGKISASELRNCMRATGEELSAEEAEEAVRLSDSDGDGELGLQDFAKLVEAEDEHEKDKSLMDAFRMYEMDARGCITPKSLRRMLRKLGDDKTVEDCTAMIGRFDLNGDGVLSFEEFKIMMK